MNPFYTNSLDGALEPEIAEVKLKPTNKNYTGCVWHPCSNVRSTIDAANGVIPHRIQLLSMERGC